MQIWHSNSNGKARPKKRRGEEESPITAVCLQIVDLCLLGILFLAPLFFGGRHMLGRFVFILLATTAGVAWFTRQTLLHRGTWTHSWANVLGLAMLLLVTLQLVPLPVDWLERLAPRNMSLLPLWASDTSTVAHQGLWSTLSLTPSSTKIALATLIAYVLLFVIVSGRLQQRSDIERMLRWIAVATALMATFGILQYFTSNGLFYWFYEHPYTTTSRVAKGSFSTRNHFAHFIALGVGPLLAWIVLQQRSNKPNITQIVLLHASLGIVALAVLLSMSRGGALSLAIASTVSIVIFYRRRMLASSYFHGLIITSLLIIGALSFSDYEKVTERLDDFAGGSIEELDKNHGRRKIWAANIAATRQGALFGAGAGSHREIYPVYLPESTTVEYTHAENGYLQIATENGFLGIIALGLSLMLTAVWCWNALRKASSGSELALAGAVTASLATSVVHSAVDFVWFIPACMSLTVILAACALRLAQLTQSHSASPCSSRSHSKIRRLSLTIATACMAAWAISSTVGPAKASLHWDKYLCIANENKKDAHVKLAADTLLDSDNNQQLARYGVMISHLQKILAADPNSARGHFRLAGKYLQYFNVSQNTSGNSMSVEQIRSAAMVSQFGSSEALKKWLSVAFGENSKLLYRAHYHITKALQLCPLQGKAYLHLSSLCFLQGQDNSAIEAYLEQSMLTRPYEGRTLFDVGRQRLLLGETEKALDIWKQIYAYKGSHQLKIISLLAGRMSIEAFTQLFQPNWQTIPHVWKHYRNLSSEPNNHALLAYALKAAQSECSSLPPKQAAHIWFNLANMQEESGLHTPAIASIQNAYRLSPSHYPIRRSLAQKQFSAGQFKQAEIHLRWCLARNPDDVSLQRTLLQVSKAQLSSNAEKTPVSRF